MFAIMSFDRMWLPRTLDMRKSKHTTIMALLWVATPHYTISQMYNYRNVTKSYTNANVTSVTKASKLLGTIFFFFKEPIALLAITTLKYKRLASKYESLKGNRKYWLIRATHKCAPFPAKAANKTRTGNNECVIIESLPHWYKSKDVKIIININDK